MFRTLLLLVTVHAVSAHLPAFSDSASYTPTEWQEQSVGIYVDPTSTFTLNLGSVQTGDKFELSLSVPPQSDLTTDDIDVEVHGASLSVCEDAWDGWGGRRLSAGHADEALDMYVNTDNEVVFEPFGVGYYRPLKACKATFLVASDAVVVNLHLTKARKFSIGLGMKEQFSSFISPALQLSLNKQYQWAGRTQFMILVPGIVVACCVVWSFAKRGTQQLRDGKTAAWIELGALFFLMSPANYFVHILWVVTKQYEWTGAIWSAWLMHVIVPIICSVWLWLRHSTDAPYSGQLREKVQKWYTWVSPILTGTTLLLLLLGCWQSYYIGNIIFGLGMLKYLSEKWKQRKAVGRGDGGDEGGRGVGLWVPLPRYTPVLTSETSAAPMKLRSMLTTGFEPARL